MVTRIGDEDPQAVVSEATAGETIAADSEIVHTLTEPLSITTPRLTLVGCTLELAAEANANLVEIGADGVRFVGFHLDGNREEQSGDRQTNGIVVTGASDVSIADGRIADVSRHGIRIVDVSTPTSFVEGNTASVESDDPPSNITIRNVRVTRPRRDGCSIEGPGTTDVTVDGIHTVGSSDRGCVEAKDGASNVLITGCYAEDCRYGVAVQDHGTYPPSNVRIAHNAATACDTLVDAQTSHPPEQVAIVNNQGWDLHGDGMGGPGGIHAHLLHGVLIANNLLDGVEDNGITVGRCRHAVVRGNMISSLAGAGIAVADSVLVALTDNHVRSAQGYGITCGGDEPGTDGVQVSDNACFETEGFHLAGAVDRYLVSSNLVDALDVEDAVGSGTIGENLVGEASPGP